jgi:hypothetical protein
MGHMTLDHVTLRLDLYAAHRVNITDSSHWLDSTNTATALALPTSRRSVMQHPQPYPTLTANRQNIERGRDLICSRLGQW